MRGLYLIYTPKEPASSRSAPSIIPKDGSLFYPLMALGMVNPFTAFPVLFLWGTMLALDGKIKR